LDSRPCTSTRDVKADEGSALQLSSGGITQRERPATRRNDLAVRSARSKSWLRRLRDSMRSFDRSVKRASPSRAGEGRARWPTIAGSRENDQIDAIVNRSVSG